MTLLEALQVAKSMKRPIIYVHNGYLLGTDPTFSTLSRIILSEPIEDLPMPFGSKMNEVYSGNKLYAAMVKSPDTFFSFYKKLTDNIYINSFDEESIRVRILGIQHRCEEIMSHATYIGGLNDITKNPDFQSMLSLKTGDGAVMYNYDTRYIMSTFATIHPVTKTDVLDLSIYHIDNRSFMAKFICKKKKSIVVEEFIRYRYL